MVSRFWIVDDVSVLLRTLVTVELIVAANVLLTIFVIVLLIVALRVLLTALLTRSFIVVVSELLTISVMVELMVLIAEFNVEEVSDAPLSAPAERKFPESVEITVAEDVAPSSSV